MSFKDQTIKLKLKEAYKGKVFKENLKVLRKILCIFLEISIHKEGRKVSVCPGNAEQRRSREGEKLTGIVLLSIQNQGSMLKRPRERSFTIVNSAE